MYCSSGYSTFVFFAYKYLHPYFVFYDERNIDELFPFSSERSKSVRVHWKRIPILIGWILKYRGKSEDFVTSFLVLQMETRLRFIFRILNTFCFARS